METLLLTISFIGVVFLLLTPWTKTSAIIAIASLIGYLNVVGVDGWTPILLISIGFILIIAEVFIPDFGLLGILGVLSVAWGLYMTTGDFGIMIRDLTIAIISSVIILILLLRNGYSISHLNRFVLNTASKEPFEIEESEDKPRLAIGMLGEARTPLRPSGKVKFEQFPLPFDVISNDGHIQSGTKVVIQEIHGNKIVVRNLS